MPYFWASPTPPENITQRPSSFSVNNPDFSSYHEKRLAQFKYHAQVLQQHDQKLVGVSLTALLFAKVLSDYLIGMPVALGLTFYAGMMARDRAQLVQNFQGAKRDLCEDLQWLNDSSGASWQVLLGDGQVQKIIEALAPFEKKDVLKLWCDGDLKVTSMFSGQSDRSDLPDAFIQLLRRVNAREFESKWTFRWYGSDGGLDLWPMVKDSMTSLVRTGVHQVIDIARGPAPVTP